MSLVKKTGAFLWGTTKSIAGVDNIRSLFRQTKYMAVSATKDRCPACQKGHLFPVTVPAETGESLHFVGCSQCDYMQAKDLLKDKQSVIRLTDLLAARFRDEKEKQAALKGLKMTARIRYFFSLITMLVAIYFLISGNVGWGFVNALSVSICFFTIGLKHSYRHWQITTNTFLQPGSFREWLKLGLWWV